ncbi:putative hydrolase YxeP [Andreesenia angusta]|uniref:Putative hydrolase YxeP n=1 Tax=Andreesenia angusta TaxID=39480 RepID=A0A1S1V8I2_9FIRM|nr:amidohydrolase [Andreesenia angusta]OHW62715.1 putative hydrolase YxeP [Andreesenia angusta]
MSNMLEKAKQIEEYVISFRRDLHRHPELSNKEFRTQERIMEELDKLGVPYEKVGTTSLIANIKGGKPGKTVALRGDMDALPIIEETEIDFKSENQGVMHGCGHDAHAAMLLGAAKLLSEMKDELAGEVRLFFQEGEENFSGAKMIIEAGGMEGVDACFGMHLMPGLETGYVDITPGYRMAGCDNMYVRFEGVSGHGSAPHLAKDTIHPASTFVTDLQGIVAKNVDARHPIVISVGKFDGGTRANVVAKYTQLDISMRSFTPESREAAIEGIKRHAKAIAEAYEIKSEVILEESAISLYNDEEIVEIASQSAIEVFGEGKNIALDKFMGSEDMAYYFEHAKGAYAMLGYRNESKEAIYYPHHEKYKIDEDALKYGTALHVQFAIDFLSR